jgi:phage terminase large subunit GpA-like protein
MGVQEVRWDKGGTVRAEDYNFFYAKRKRKSIANRVFCTPAVKRAEFVSDRVSYMTFERSLV